MGIVTSMNDDSVGEIISGSSGIPDPSDVDVSLYVAGQDSTLSNMRFLVFLYVCRGLAGLRHFEHP